MHLPVDRSVRIRAAAALSIVVVMALVSPARADDAVPFAVSAALQRAAIPEAAVSIYVQRVGTPPARSSVEPDDAAPMLPTASETRGAAPLLGIRLDRAMNPASTMKLVTTYAALELLGPAFTWKTLAATTAPQNGSTLDGDLVLRGAGDPKFVVESFWLLLRQLRARGIRTVRGDLVLDRSLFEPVAYDAAAFDNEPFRPYNVAPDALLVNFKAITLRFMPDEARHEVRLSVEPPLADFNIAAPAWADGPCGDWKGRLGADLGRSDRIVFAGAFPGACGEQTWNVAVLDHRAYTVAVFKALWTELGGTWTGAVRDGVMPVDARVLAERESPALAETVRDINKYSNNVMARELFLSLAAEVTRQPANIERAQRTVKGFYGGKGIAMPELVIENGSGLSRRERISAGSMGRLLQAAWSSPVMPEFVSSLPLVGFDGTMRRRLNLRTVAGQAHVKTGTLSDVRAVAGYVLSASGRRYAVVMFVNHANAGAAQPAQDALLQWVFDKG